MNKAFAVLLALFLTFAVSAPALADSYPPAQPSPVVTDAYSGAEVGPAPTAEPVATPTATSLPRTGVSVGTVALVAGGLILGGFFLVRSGRLRR